MVDKIARISSTAATSATRIDHSVSVSEPDVALAAQRQAAIDFRLSGRKPPDHHDGSNPEEPAGEDDGLGNRHLDLHSTAASHDDELKDEKLSGESDRIGTGNLSEDVPFGKHSGFL